jgi:hypothetical protein
VQSRQAAQDVGGRDSRVTGAAATGEAVRGCRGLFICWLLVMVRVMRVSGCSGSHTRSARR